MTCRTTRKTVDMKYSMEAEIEADRLEEQVAQSNYSLKEELSRFQFRPDERVLDAGCGTGVLSRYLVDEFSLSQVDAVDYSDLRLMQAEKLSKAYGHNTISFSKQDLENLDSSFYGKYDTVLCRYVVEHSANPVRVLEELRKALKPGGRVIIFELDGVFVNLHSQNARFNEFMAKVREGVRFDLHIGRKIPAYLKRVGFTDIQWQAELLVCKGERLTEERINTEKRFAALVSFFTELFGSKASYEEFRQIYLDEMVKPENTLVFTKYICSGKRT